MILKYIIPLIIFTHFYLFSSAQDDSLRDFTDTSRIYTIVETMPSFPGGYDSLQRYLSSSTQLSNAIIKNKVKERIYSTVIISSSGELIMTWYDNSIDFQISNYFKNVFNDMPLWNPGIHNSHPVKVKFRFPIIVIDYENGISIDTTGNIDSLSAVDLNTRIKFFQDYTHGYFKNRAHSVYLDKAVEELEKGNYQAAIKKFDNALVANPLDTAVLQGRAFTYLNLNKFNLGCDDMKFVGYLTEMSDTQLINKLMCCCVVDYFFDKNFLSRGYIVPPLMHGKGNETEEPLIPPSFPGGMDSLYKFLGANFIVKKNIDYPTFHSRILVRFTVKKDGTIKDPQVINFGYGSLVTEAYRLVNLMPKWIPAFKGNEKVEVEYIFPIINFKTRRNEYFIKENSSYNKGVNLLNNSDYDEALLQFTEAIRVDSFDIDSHYNRGICYWKMQNKTKACYDWSFASFYSDENSIKLIDRFCDSLIIIDMDTASSSFFKNVPDDSTGSNSLPYFSEGWATVEKFILSQVRTEKIYKEFAGTIDVKVIISKTGKILFPRVRYNFGKVINEEAVRLVRLLPSCIPGMRNDKPVETWIYLPIRFKQL